MGCRRGPASDAGGDFDTVAWRQMTVWHRSSVVHDPHQFPGESLHAAIPRPSTAIARPSGFARDRSPALTGSAALPGCSPRLCLGTCAGARRSRPDAQTDRRGARPCDRRDGARPGGGTHFQDPQFRRRTRSPSSKSSSRPTSRSSTCRPAWRPAKRAKSASGCRCSTTSLAHCSSRSCCGPTIRRRRSSSSN